MMKYLILAITCASLLTVSCKKDKPVGGEEKQVTEVSQENTVNYTLDVEQSSVKWRGYKIADGKEDGHYGTMKLNSNGQFTVANGVLTGGTFEVAMNTIVVEDLDEETGKSKLEIHLKEGDFFDVEKYPTAKFEITKVTPQTEGEFNTQLEGNFTIKEQTKSYTFLANTSETDSTYTINTQEFDINRQEFGVNYKSTIKDVVLKDNITLQISIVGDKQ